MLIEGVVKLLYCTCQMHELIIGTKTFLLRWRHYEKKTMRGSCIKMLLFSESL